MKIMKKIIIYSFLVTGLMLGSCKKFLDVNDDPNNITRAEVTTLLPSITVNVGYLGGSDLMRVSTLIMQQFSGNGPLAGFSAFKEYERYNVNDSDINNQWVSIFGTILSDLDLLINQAEIEGSPHYSGVGKVLKAYVYQIVVDAWGDVPYSEASKHSDNYYPKLDDDEEIYADLVRMIDEGIVEINAANSVLSPNNYSTIYKSSSWESSKTKWIRFANTLKLRIFLHYSAKDPAFATQKMKALINSGAEFMQSTDDNFEMPFFDESQRQNPLYGIEKGQFKNQFYPHRFIVDLMTSRNDPRRTTYFVPFPYNSNPATYKGASILDGGPSAAYSRLHTYIYGAGSAINSALIDPDGSIRDGAIEYAGDSPGRLLSFAEYNFIRAEGALLYGLEGNAQSFFEEGIKASFKDAKINAGQMSTYLANHGTLTGSNGNKLEQIINEKYIANFGVVVEPWTDYRRTGYPALQPLSAPLSIYSEVPRSLFYSQSEINNNPNVNQKASMLDRVFWDTRTN